MRNNTHNNLNASTKTCNSAASKITKFIDDLFLPMADAPDAIVRPFTTFDAIKIYDTSLIQHIAMQDPGIVSNKDTFIRFISKMYDEWCQTETF